MGEFTQTQQKSTELFELMKSSIYPRGISGNEFKKLLYAVQYAERFPAKESQSGRRAGFDAAFLVNSSLKIKGVFQNETLRGRICPTGFRPTKLAIAVSRPE